MNHYTRLTIVLLIFALLFTACNKANQEDQAKAAAVALLANTALPGIADGMMNPIFTGNALWAIDQALATKNGAYMMLHQAKQVAVFVCPGVKDYTAQVSYWLWGFIDLKSGALIDAATRFPGAMGQSVNAKTMADVEKLLADNGFVKLTPAALPTLAATLRAAIAYIKALGTSTIQILVVPGGVLTPGWFYDLPEGIDS